MRFLMDQSHATRHQLFWLAVRCTAALMASPGYVPEAWAQSNQICVTNYTDDTVTVYSRKGTGDVAPLYSIPVGIGAHNLAINHSRGELIVSNNQAYSISI